MSADTRNTFKFIIKLLNKRSSFYFWFLVRFLSALLPLLTVYLFSRFIKLFETNAEAQKFVSLSLFILLNRLADNFSRLLSTTKLNNIIGNIKIDINGYFTQNLRKTDSGTRQRMVEAIRNFSDAVAVTLDIIKQPGVDSLVSFIAIPIILFFLDFRIFIIQLAYITVYYFTDVFTTEKYVHFKNKYNLGLEKYFSGLQKKSSNQINENRLRKNIKRLCSWDAVEWLLLQNTAVIFYSLSILILSMSAVQVHSISNFVLIMGYISGTQDFLNNMSHIKDRLTDTKVALNRLMDKTSSISVDFDDLMTT